MSNSPSPRQRATEALGEPVEDWIHRHRNSAAKLTRGQLARVLEKDYGVKVSAEAIRLWELSASEPNGNEAA